MAYSDYKSHCIKVAGVIALLGNAILALVKILLAYLSGSLAVMGDGIDSARQSSRTLSTSSLSNERRDSAFANRSPSIFASSDGLRNM